MCTRILCIALLCVFTVHQITSILTSYIISCCCDLECARLSWRTIIAVHPCSLVPIVRRSRLDLRRPRDRKKTQIKLSSKVFPSKIMAKIYTFSLYKFFSRQLDRYGRTTSDSNSARNLFETDRPILNSERSENWFYDDASVFFSPIIFASTISGRRRARVFNVTGCFWWKIVHSWCFEEVILRHFP